MKIRRKHKEETELHVGPLNDILFILLFFFLLASTFAGLNAIKVNLPKGKSTTKVEQKVTITMDSTKQMYLNTKTINSDSLFAYLNSEKQKDTTISSIVFNGDLKVNYGDFVKVVAAANKLKLKVALNVSGVE